MNYIVCFTNIINPICWGIVFLYILKNVNIRFNINKRQLLYFITIVFLSIGIYLALGYMYGFSKTPYSHKIVSILKNIVIQIIPIMGMEILRIALVKKYKNNKLILVGITILLILLQINYNVLVDLHSNKEEMFKYICSIIVPLIICNVLYMYFILNDAYFIALNYRILGNLCMLLVPIFPNVDWYVKGSTGILLPIFMYLLFFNILSICKNLYY